MASCTTILVLQPKSALPCMLFAVSCQAKALSGAYSSSMRQYLVSRPSGTDWLRILLHAKDRVMQSISPLMSSSNRSRLSLGIGAGGDPLRKIDLVAERAISETFQENGTSFTLVSEESGTKKFGRNPSECFVTTDPIDGSTNLARNIPFYATSIAVSTEPTLATVHSALVADLFHNVTYTAQRGKGAYCDGEMIAPTENSILEDAVIGVDINALGIEELVSRLSELVLRVKHLRHLGANALELCYVADGKSDAFIDVRRKLRATDIAAAWLIAEEAGAKITSPDGKPVNLRLDPKQKVDFIASANSKMHTIILNLIRQQKEKEC